MTEIALRVQSVVKDFDVYDRPRDLAIEILTRRKRHKTFRALDGISIEVPKGEILGIIGSNGAGKSTLLKIITGVLDATSGSVEISGRVTAILELGLGFNPEYSGRENIFLSGLLYGMDRPEIERKLDSIVEFSGLGNFIERPVKTYSSGMHARLAFSIATAAEPEILIIDEALSAGDAMFLQKCTRRLHELCAGGRTVLMVSHGTTLLAQICTRVAWLERGKIKMLDSPLAVVQAYDIAAHQGANEDSWIEEVDDRLAPDLLPESSAFDADTTETPPNQVFRRGPLLIEKVTLLNNRGEPTSRLGFLDPYTVRVEYRCDGALPKETLGVAIAINQRSDLKPIMSWFSHNRLPDETPETYLSAPFRKPPQQRGTIELRFPYAPFRPGEYFLSIGLLPNIPGAWSFYEYRHFFYTFSVEAPGFELGAPIFLVPRVVSSERLSHEESSNLLAENNAATDRDPATLGEEVAAICFKDGGYPERWPKHKGCPACASQFIKDAFVKGGFQHRRCQICGLIFLDPYPPREIRDRLYAGQYYTKIREFYELPRARSGLGTSEFTAPREILEEVIENATSAKTRGDWLDVGGGLGAFGGFVKERRPKWSVALNDDNPKSLEIARELFDLEVISTSPEEIFSQGRRFDVVSSVAVLEHVPEPLEFLQTYASLLRTGGMLVVIIPQFTPLNAAISKAASPNATPPFHTSLFDECSFRTLLERVKGFSKVTIEQRGPAAFSLLEHVNFGDHWDVAMPSAEEPLPKSIKLKPYTAEETRILNALDMASKEVGDYFARTDGRLYLVGYLLNRQ
ncbi:MAG: ATP-binding cassette domain-containing protein [Proteobacteria bacterium]|nr:ATP-binding cassette domain-containing protein [Pseudomonadota bacterium]